MLVVSGVRNASQQWQTAAIQARLAYPLGLTRLCLFRRRLGGVRERAVGQGVAIGGSDASLEDQRRGEESSGPLIFFFPVARTLAQTIRLLSHRFGVVARSGPSGNS